MTVKFKTYILHSLLVGVCVAGDQVLLLLQNSGPWAKALVDNWTHGVIGLLCWTIVTDGKQWLEIVTCAFLASVLDVDHFLAAKSVKLDDALNLQYRPPFHNTLLLGVITGGFLLVSALFKNVLLQRYSWLFFVAWFSHHMRDAHRRGLWFGDLGVLPCPYWVYLLTVTALPLTVSTWLRYCGLVDVEKTILSDVTPV